MRTSVPVTPSVLGALLVGVLTFTTDAAAQDAPRPTEPADAESNDQDTESEESEEAVDSKQPAKPQTQAADIGFGTNQLAERYHFPDPDAYAARVDNRDAIDATSHRTILMPTAHTPEQWTVSYSNFQFFYNTLSVSVSDDVQLGIGAVFPSPTIDFVGGLSAKFALSEGPNTKLALQPFVTHRAGRGELATSDAGGGASFLADFALTNDIVATLGATAYGTVWVATREFTYEDCESRSDFISGECRDTRATNHFGPSGGHWLAVQAAATYYLTDNFSLRGELISGGSLGSVLGTEWLRDDFDTEQDGARFLEGTAQFGIPYSSELTAGAGFAWSNGIFAVSLSGYLFRAIEQNVVSAAREPAEIWAVTPMFNLAATL